MYLSRIRLNPRSRQVQLELKDPYQMHRTLARAFANGPADYKDARVLFRVDEDRDGHLSVLVQSKTQPDWSRISYDKGYAEDAVPVKELNPSLREGDTLRFRLKANPTVRKDGKRLGLYKDEEQMNWLLRKAGTHGFKVLSVSAKPAEKASSSTSEAEGKFAVARFDGVLQITDAVKFLEALESGIGSGKGFGFGLLSLART